MSRWVRSTGQPRERRVLRLRTPGLVPVQANLQRPRLADHLVLRGELVDQLRERTDVPAVLVSAPAGYGKTTLLAQWDDEDERPFVWLTPDDACNDPAVLVTYLELALQQIGEVDPGVVGALAERSQVATVVLPRLGRLITQQPPFVLVVDDADRISSPAALEVLTTVAQHLNEGSQLALAARTPPGLPWSQLRAERGLLTIDQGDLRLTPTEARAVVAATDLDLAPAEVSGLLERTEGWAAGIAVAALSLHHAAARRGAPAPLGSLDSVLGAYLHDELLGGLSPERRRFLVRTSVLERMCGALCDAVLDTTGSADVLDELARANMFIVPLGGPEGWCRYHHLLAAVLHEELAREPAAVVEGLHARASRWLESAADIEAAVEHAQAAHEVERAARLVWSQTGPLLASGRTATVRRWLEGFSNQQVVEHTKLSLAAAWCALAEGRPFEHWITAAERGVYDASRPEEARSVASALRLLHAVRAADGVQQMQEDAEQAASLQATDEPFRAASQYLQAVSLLLLGSPEEARDQLETAGRLAEALAMPAYQALCLAQEAVLAVEAGHWEEAAELSEAGSAVLADHDVRDEPWLGLVDGVAAVVHARAGHAELARRHARHCMRMIATTSECPAWLAVETRYLLGRANLLMGDTAAARVLLSEAQLQLHAAPDASWLQARLEEAWNQVERFPLATGVGPSALTSAELRVLQLLPTHLSFEEIGKRLFLSRNTVKTQAIAAYRKLGVASRAEAVGRARVLGMV